MGTSLNIQQWSTTAASNSTADTGLPTIADTMAGTDLDDALRGIMASVRRYAKDFGGAVTVGGTADAIALTTNQAISSAHQALGFSIRFKAGSTNTGAVTVAVDGLTAVALKNASGSDLTAGDIISGGIYDIAFDGSTYKLLGGAGQFQPIDTDLTAIGALAKTDGNFIVGNGSAWVAESGSTARASLGLTIGTDVQAYSAQLAAIAALAVTDGNFAVGNGTTWVAESGSTARTSLGLGSIATQASSSVTITGGSITGITDIAVADGGTGASTAADARTNLGLAIGSDVQAYSATLAAVAGGTYTGATSITTLGTIATGTWSGTAIAATKGGTGATTAGAGFKALGDGLSNDPFTVAPSVDRLTVRDNTDGSWGSFTVNTVVRAGFDGVSNDLFTVLPSVDRIIVKDNTDGSYGSFAVNTIVQAALDGGATVNNSTWSGTDLSVANGGTGQSTAVAGARALLDGLGTTGNNVPYHNGTQWTVIGAKTAASSLSFTGSRGGSWSGNTYILALDDNGPKWVLTGGWS